MNTLFYLTMSGFLISLPLLSVDYKQFLYSYFRNREVDINTKIDQYCGAGEVNQTYENHNDSQSEEVGTNGLSASAEHHTDIETNNQNNKSTQTNYLSYLKGDKSKKTSNPESSQSGAGNVRKTDANNNNSQSDKNEPAEKITDIGSNQFFIFY